MPEAKPGPKRPLGLQAKMYDNDRPGQPAILVLYICVGFWLLAHLTRDLSQADLKKNANLQNDNYFTQNCRGCRFE